MLVVRLRHQKSSVCVSVSVGVYTTRHHHMMYFVVTLTCHQPKEPKTFDPRNDHFTFAAHFRGGQRSPPAAISGQMPSVTLLYLQPCSWTVPLLRLP
jgi:hypothetical protein